MKKKLFFLIFMLLSIFCIASCSKKNKDVLNRIEEINQEETYQEVPGELQTEYTDMSSLIIDAGEIVKVKVLEQSVEYLDGYPQTHTKVEVEQIGKGSLNIGDTIEVIEEGGIEGKVLGNIPQLSEDFGYVLLLTEYNENYYILGAFQGRFIEREGYLFQQATVNTKLSRYSPMTTDDFFKMVKDNLE